MNLPDLEINLLRAFIAVADGGSFTSAAQTLGRSQSAVSQKILRLETLIGDRIFERSSRSLALTPIGERLLAAAREIIDSNDRVVRALREPSAAGSLRLGISEDFLPDHLPKMLTRFARFYPGVQIDLTTGLSCNLIASYEDKRLDAIIAKRDARTHRGRVIWRDPICWMASAEYQAEQGDMARLVMLPMPCSYREIMIDALARVRRDWTIACTASSIMGVQAAVAGGLGVTALGRSFLRKDMQVLSDARSWPTLPASEIVILSEEEKTADLVRILISFLTESLAGSEVLHL